ncbi:uncharacterized protein ACJ7VT_012112 [Polymixia lowei]
MGASLDRGRIYPSLGLFVLFCLVSFAKCLTGQILPPQNVSVIWITGNEFCPTVSWAPPENISEDCDYHLVLMSRDRWLDATLNAHTPFMAMEGGVLDISLQTECGNEESESVLRNITYSELVKDLECSQYSTTLTNCSWKPVPHVPDLQLFYRSENRDGTTVGGRGKCSELNDIKECSLYQHRDGLRTGCQLQGSLLRHAIYFLFNGTVNNVFALNTFKRCPIDNVRPPPLKWTVTKDGDHLNVSWFPPDVSDLTWTYEVNYTQCDERKNKLVKSATSILLIYDSNCKYDIAVKGVLEDNEKGETPWGQVKSYGEDRNPYRSIYAAAVLIPVMFAAFAALAFVCFRKHKEKFFPKVPKPPDVLKDMLNNNKTMNSTGDLYIPAQEEDCNISLVIEPQTTES